MAALHDLYGVLGVEKGADKAAIRGAYRRRAKTAHPDGGGSTEEFALVALAHDVLTDPGRRAHYDSTGEYGQKAPDNKHADAVNLISIALDAVLQTLNEGDALGYVIAIDMVAKMRVALMQYKEQAMDNMRMHREVKAINDKLVRRFKRKDGGSENLITAMIFARIAAVNEAIEFQERQIKAVNMALDILKDYVFETEGQPPAPVSFIQQMMKSKVF